MNKFNIIRAFTCLLTLAYATCFAGQEKVSEVEKGASINGAILYVSDQYFGQTGNYTTVSQNATVKIYHNDVEKVKRDYNWNLEVIYDASLYFQDGTSLTVADTLYLSGDDATNDGIDNNIALKRYMGAGMAAITVTSATLSNSTGNLTISDGFLSRSVYYNGTFLLF